MSNLMNIPDDLLSEMFLQIPTEELPEIAPTCKRMKAIVKDLSIRALKDREPYYSAQGFEWPPSIPLHQRVHEVNQSLIQKCSSRMPRPFTQQKAAFLESLDTPDPLDTLDTLRSKDFDQLKKLNEELSFNDFKENLPLKMQASIFTHEALVTYVSTCSKGEKKEIIIKAIKSGYVKIIPHLLKKDETDQSGVDVNEPLDEASQQYPLHYAVFNNQVDIARIFIEREANVSVVDLYSRTPLHFVTDVRMARMLIAHGASVKVKDGFGRTPLASAARFHCEPSLLQELIQRTSDVNAVGNGGQTVLHNFMKSLTGEGKVEIDSMHLLLSNGASPNSRDSDGKTPLHYAARLSYFEGMKLLLEFGADVNARSTTGATPLHEIGEQSLDEKQSVRSFSLLLNSGADVNAQDRLGNTPLHTVAHLGKEQYLMPLLLSEPNVNIKNIHGGTPLDELEKARARGLYGEEKYNRMRDVLLAAGAKNGSRI